MDKKNTRLEVYKLIEIGKTSKEIAEELKISLRTAQTYIKEYKSIQTQDANKTQDARENKKRKEIAKAKIITGASLKRVAEQTGTPKSTLANWSSKENLQQKQAEFLEKYRNERIKLIQDAKDRRLAKNLSILNDIELMENSEQVQRMLMMNEKTEQEIFELEKLIKIKRLEIESRKAQIEEDNDKLDEVLGKLESIL